MSRRIESRPSGWTAKDAELIQTGNGKLLVTRYQGKYLSLLLSDNRLLAASASGGEGEVSKVGAVYIGKIKKIVKNIEACFVEISDGELCYLALSDCKNPFLLNRSYDGRVLEGDELLVQVVRDALKTKQAAVTAKITLNSSLLVLAMGNPKVSVSSKLSGEEKQAILSLLREKQIITEKGHLFQEEGLPSFGMIVRTEAAAAGEEQLLEEYSRVREQYVELLRSARYRTCFSCMLEPGKPYMTVLEQVYPREYQEVVTDLPEIYEELKAYIHKKRFLKGKEQLEIPVRLYEDDSYTLAKLYAIETKLKEALASKVWLKSGGYLVIEPTEALTVIDVNSGKFEAGKAAEETFYQINREAAREIALQLRLRNLSGIIIIDFINLKDTTHQEALLQYLRQLTQRDCLTTTVIDMTPLGLVELTRQKKNKTLKEQLA